MLHIFHRLVSPYYLQIYRFQFRLNLYLQLVPSLLPKMCFNPILHTINNDNHSLPTYWSANLNHVKNHSFINLFIYLLSHNSCHIHAAHWLGCLSYTVKFVISKIIHINRIAQLLFSHVWDTDSKKSWCMPQLQS